MSLEVELLLYLKKTRQDQLLGWETEVTVGRSSIWRSQLAKK